MRRGRTKRTANERGFTLLEVLASVVIVGVALSVLVLERNRSVERVGRTDRLRLATLLAQSKLDELLLGEEAAGSGSFEEHEGFTWEAAESSALFGGDDRSVNLTVLTVTVRYDGGVRSFRLRAVRGR